MNYEQTLKYLYSQLPVFQRTGAAAYKATLDNTYALCKLVDNPQQGLKCIHIAGTNGKGSTSHTMASILQAAGYKTGLYTSPHLKDFRERIRINGQVISEQEVVEFVERFRQEFEKIGLSFFEWTVGLALYHFKKEKTDVAVIEVGMGGRLDSTNVIHPDLAIITNVSYDHEQFLGNSLEEIALEKAGIIKPTVPVIIGEKHPETASVFLQKAIENNCPIRFASDCEYSLPETDLTGAYQKKNLITVLSAIENLQKQGYDIRPEHIETGLKTVKASTGLSGRWHMLNTRPLTICDVGHNESGIKEVVEMIGRTPHEKLHIVFGVVKDKSPEKILRLLPAHATYYVCKAAIPRAMEAEELCQKMKSLSLDATAYDSVQEALAAAQENASELDFIFIGGSTFVVAEVL